MKEKFNYRFGWLLCAAVSAALPLFFQAAGAYAQGVTTGGTVKIRHVPITYVSPVDGPKMYAQYCASCHGAEGRGDGPAAPALSKPATDLTALSANNGGEFPLYKVHYALGGNAHFQYEKQTETMPYWYGMFASKDGNGWAHLRAYNLVSHIRKMQSPRSSASESGNSSTNAGK